MNILVKSEARAVKKAVEAFQALGTEYVIALGQGESKAYIENEGRRGIRVASANRSERYANLEEFSEKYEVVA